MHYSSTTSRTIVPAIINSTINRIILNQTKLNRIIHFYIVSYCHLRHCHWHSNFETVVNNNSKMLVYFTYCLFMIRQ